MDALSSRRAQSEKVVTLARENKCASQLGQGWDLEESAPHCVAERVTKGVGLLFQGARR